MIEKEYLASRIATANEAQLVAILFEGLIDSLSDGIDGLKNGEREKFNLACNKSRDIIAELLGTLNGDSEIANNYRSLYIYVNTLITKADIARDEKKLQEAIKVLKPLYEGWSELGDKLFKDEVESSKAPKVVTGMTYGKGYMNDYVVNNDTKWEKG